MIDHQTNFYQRDRRPINGTFQGRGRNYLSLLTCPIDGAPLALHVDGVRCDRHADHLYPFNDGVLQLVASDRRADLAALSQEHDAHGTAQGWRSPNEGEFKSLPQTALTGYPEDYWPAQATATALLWRFLEAIRRQNGDLPIAPLGEAAVIDAGMGWLAYGLDVAGYTTLALDARAGDQHGLGVYPIARFLRVQADLAQLPLAPGAFDWLIFQEGLCPLFEGAADEQATFNAALHALRPGGWLAVMNSLEPQAEAERVHTHFADAGLVLMEPPDTSGWRARLLELRDRLRGRERDIPPVFVAQKPQ